MEYKVEIQFNKDMMTYVAEIKTLGLSAVGDSVGQAAANIEMAYIYSLEEMLKQGKTLGKETTVTEVSDQQKVHTQEMLLDAQKEISSVIAASEKKDELLIKILNTKKTPEEKLELVKKLSESKIS